MRRRDMVLTRPLTDVQREQAIQECVDFLTRNPRSTRAGEVQARMYQLIRERSPAQVRRMEIERGLAG